MPEKFSNNAHSTLWGAIDDSVTTLSVHDASGWPAANFRITVGSEIMLVTGKLGTMFTVVRAQEGTSAASHADGTVVSHRLTAGSLAQAIVDHSGSVGALEIIIVSPGTGIYVDIELPFAGTWTGWSVYNDAGGSITYDVWVDTYANFPPTVADSCTASDKPKTTNAAKAQGACSGWNSATFLAGSVARINVDSTSGLGRSVLVLKYARV
jgi:hypothetical protein